MHRLLAPAALAAALLGAATPAFAGDDDDTQRRVRVVVRKADSTPNVVVIDDKGREIDGAVVAAQPDGNTLHVTLDNAEAESLLEAFGEVALQGDFEGELDDEMMDAILQWLRGDGHDARHMRERVARELEARHRSGRSARKRMRRRGAPGAGPQGHRDDKAVHVRRFTTGPVVVRSVEPEPGAAHVEIHRGGPGHHGQHGRRGKRGARGFRGHGYGPGHTETSRGESLDPRALELLEILLQRGHDAKRSYARGAQDAPPRPPAPPTALITRFGTRAEPGAALFVRGVAGKPGGPGMPGEAGTAGRMTTAADIDRMIEQLDHHKAQLQALKAQLEAHEAMHAARQAARQAAHQAHAVRSRPRVEGRSDEPDAGELKELRKQLEEWLQRTHREGPGR